MKNQSTSPEDFEYDIYVPIFDNNGKRYAEEIMAAFKSRLVEKFGGLTDTRIRNEGTWKTGRAVYRDEIVIWRALSLGKSENDFMTKIKEEMKIALGQEEVLIVSRQVKTL